MTDEIYDGPETQCKNGDTEPLDEEGARASFGHEKSSVKHLLPVGLQVIKLTELSSAFLNEDEADVSLVATRVWLRRTKGEIFLHLGDVESGALED